MFKNKKIYAYTSKYISALVALASVVLQFIPFWDAGKLEGAEHFGKVSISQYMWFPQSEKLKVVGVKYKFKSFEEAIKAWIEDPYYYINQTINVTVFVFILCVLTFIFCVFTNKIWNIILPFAAGLVGLVGYMTRPEMQLGSNWQVHVVLFAVLIVSAIQSACILILDLKTPKQKNTK